MQEKRNKRLLVTLVILMIITACIYAWRRGGTDDAVGKDHFRSFDVSRIDSVVLRHLQDTVVLEVTAGRWKVNGHWNADRNLIDVLMATILQAEPRRPVARSLNDSLAAQLQSEGIRVSLFSGDEKLDEFLAGGNSRKTQAYFARPGEEEVWVMNIPGYRVYVSGIFELSARQWRDKHVFGFNWQNFVGLAAQYPEKPGNNFSVVMNDQYFTIPEVGKTDTTKMNDFLDAVSLLTADEYVAGNPKLDSLAGTPPLQQLVLRDLANREYRLDLYRYNDREMAGLLNRTEWAVFDHRKLRNILLPKDFFATN
ncbi:MAG TPA: DUF4340 domain-containing protein [Ohtaekwangia sp.]|nr:DUF4340 domain-containing protein [Ohtaekwangia sp.]